MHVAARASSTWMSPQSVSRALAYLNNAAVLVLVDPLAGKCIQVQRLPRLGLGIGVLDEQPHGMTVEGLQHREVDVFFALAVVQDEHGTLT